MLTAPYVDAQVDAAVALFVDLMSDGEPPQPVRRGYLLTSRPHPTDNCIISLTAGNPTLVAPMARSIIRAGALAGEVYLATDQKDGVVGFSVWMSPGKDMFTT